MSNNIFDASRGVLTIAELYLWAVKNGCEDDVIRYYDADGRWSVATGIYDRQDDDGDGEFTGEVFLAGY